jgi:hypothetical protein
MSTACYGNFMFYVLCTVRFIVSLSQNQRMHKIINKHKMYFQPLHVSASKLPSSGGIYQGTSSTYCIQIHNSWFYIRNIYATHNVSTWYYLSSKQPGSTARGLHLTKPGIGWETDVWRQILCNNKLHFNICILNCKISDYDIYHSETRCTLQMSMYVDSLMMAEIVDQNIMQ